MASERVEDVSSRKSRGAATLQVSRLAVDRLAVERGGRRILSGLTFVIGRGEALVLTGPNGAGKSTLLKTIAGFLAPCEGHIRLEGGDNERALAEQAHYVGHANGLRASLTVAENARFWAHYLGGPADRVEPALERFGLGFLAAVPAGYLSAGQKRRLGLVRLLLAPRPVWLLDEPTASLDASSSGVLAKVVDEHIAAEGLALVATHLPLGLARSRELRLGLPEGSA